MTLERDYSPGDRVLMQLQRALRVSAGPTPRSPAYPGALHPERSTNDVDRVHAAGLMRVNHAGEVSAQALYLGQAAVARDPAIREHLLEAAAQEQDHLAWCAERLAELGSAPSRFDPAWFAGAWAMGALAGLAGDRTSLGFVVETERQVEAHLGEHLTQLPEQDARSRAVVARMQADEARHGQEASAAGAELLPEPVPRLMALAAAVMKWVAYRA